MLRKFKAWIDCRLKGKHRFDYYTHRCIACNIDAEEVCNNERS